MKYLLPVLLALGLASACVRASADIDAAVADPSRPDAHRERDADRLPAEILRFAFPGPVSGLRVADLAAGGGYYTAILSRMVGPRGSVHAVNPSRLFAAFPQAVQAFPHYQDQDPRENVTYSVQKLDELRLPADLDAVFMVLYYHDTLWTGVDRAAMNRQIYQALKPGGVFLVVDHHAPAGAGAEVGRALHRMDAAIVRREVPQAGFELVGESNLLANPGDPRTVSVFDPERRGRTDRFVLLFRKP